MKVLKQGANAAGSDLFGSDAASRPRPHPEVRTRSGSLEGGFQGSQGWLEGSFEARLRLAPQDEGAGGICVARVSEGADLDGFRAAIRRLVAEDVPPERVHWQIGQTASLFGTESVASDSPALRLPRALAQWIPLIVCHRDPERYALLHTAIRRVLTDERDLLENLSDPLVHRLHHMRKAIRRDLHKMHAFLRFRRVAGEPERFAAWFEPEHHILAQAAPFFVDRFRALTWSILTPDATARWDGTTLRFGPPGRREDVPEGDGFEAGWRDYYESTFNPARLNLEAMRAEMPKKYWRNMPETAAIPELVRKAAARTAAMIEKGPQMPAKRVPAKAVAAMAEQEPASLEDLNAIIARSEPLVPGATQAVLGEGPIGATLAFVGEQPGDVEDRQGRPFVGPAGQLFDRALEEAGLSRSAAYVTNAVKHFKFTLRGKRRIHEKPTAGEVSHYRWWLDRELGFVRPKLVVALGATAVLALAGKPIPITRARGPADFGGKPFSGFITVHPSYLLRLPDEAARAEAYRAFVADLRKAGTLADILAAA